MSNQTRKTMSVNATNAVLVFMNRKRIIALYDKSIHDYKPALSLFQPAMKLPNGKEISMKACSATIYASSGEINLAYNKNTLNPAFLRVSALHKAEMFLDGENVIIGVGDMRDGISFRAELNLGTMKEGELVVNFVNDNSIEIYCINPINFNIKEPASLQCQ